MEQTFSAAERNQVERNPAGNSTETRQLIAMTTTHLGKSAEKAIVTRAGGLYMLARPQGRVAPNERTRFDKGIKRPSATFKTGTEQAWLKRRRTSVAAAAADTPATPQRPTRALPREWSSRHKKEQQKHHKRLAARRLESYRDGHLLPEEVTPGMAAANAKVQKEARTRDRARVRRSAAVEATLYNEPVCQVSLSVS
ncbi:MAG: hypothetical protein GY772_09635 [bacterium]|nr:hypothetical protein [bacterium]